MIAEGAEPAIITDHPYVPPADPNRHLCAHQAPESRQPRRRWHPAERYPTSCNMAEASHAETVRPYVPEGVRP